MTDPRECSEPAGDPGGIRDPLVFLLRVVGLIGDVVLCGCWFVLSVVGVTELFEGILGCI